jgi:hypothetical protein
MPSSDSTAAAPWRKAGDVIDSALPMEEHLRRRALRLRHTAHGVGRDSAGVVLFGSILERGVDSSFSGSRIVSSASRNDFVTNRGGLL